MSDEKNIFIKKAERPIEVFPYIKVIKKFLSIKSNFFKKIIKRTVKFIIRINYEYRCLKCDIQIKEFRDNMLCVVPIKGYKKSCVSKMIRCITEIVEKNEIKDVILSKELSKIDELKTSFFNKNLTEGKYLLKVMVDEVINYILNIKNERIENQTIHILASEYSKINLEIIELLSYKVKSVNIITNKLNKFLIFERNLYENKGIMITVSNNKRRALNKAKWIINLDFTNDFIKHYRIDRNAIVINLVEEQLEISKSFSGIIINGLKIKDDFNKGLNISKLYNIFNKTLLYESTILKNRNLTDIRQEINNDNIKIKALIGNRGVLQEAEYKNCLTNT